MEREGVRLVLVLLFIFLGMLLVGLGRFAVYIGRTYGPPYGALALLPLLAAIGVILYLGAQTL